MMTIPNATLQGMTLLPDGRLLAHTDFERYFIDPTKPEPTWTQFGSCIAGSNISEVVVLRDGRIAELHKGTLAYRTDWNLAYLWNANGILQARVHCEVDYCTGFYVRDNGHIEVSTDDESRYLCAPDLDKLQELLKT